VLSVRGNGFMAEIGTVHGIMGHVLLILSPPYSVWRHSEEGEELKVAWPPGDVDEIWRVKTLECTRAEQGLYEAEMLLYIDRSSGQLRLIAELQQDGTLVLTDPEQVELWQSPTELRAQIRLDLMAKVITEMKLNQACWSHVTAARSVLTSARIVPTEDRNRTMEHVRFCWTREPICTTLVIVFWQRYICELVQNSVPLACGQNADALDLIMRWMPLKADRSLPGDLLGAMRCGGWVSLAQIPRIFRPMVFAPSKDGKHEPTFGHPAAAVQPPRATRQVQAH